MENAHAYIQVGVTFPKMLTFVSKSDMCYLIFLSFYYVFNSFY